jgi:hypothetical protein
MKITGMSLPVHVKLIDTVDELVFRDCQIPKRGYLLLDVYTSAGSWGPRSFRG